MRSPRRSSEVGNTKTDGHEVAQLERNRTDLGATLTDGKITAPEIGHGLLEKSILTDLDEFKTGLDRVSRSLIQSEPNKKSGVQLTRGKNKWFATVQPETLKKKCPRPAFCVAWTSMWSQTLKRVRAHYPKLRRVRSCLRRRLGPGASHQTVAQSPAHIPFTPQEKSQKRKHPT
ncbi:hypothetical protein RUM44_012799 [Polyplax serrata]|uniref:Uncharacterized protein n=1 Tax=Polyplax serrata TaxID=468196 RepID=A0ABR1BGJ8_POLSC